jgi:uncharacterized membrane protein
MSTFVVTIFPNEATTYQGVHALDQLHAEGSITLYDTIVVQRQPDGTVTTKQRERTPEEGTGIGVVLGALIGVFGGPIGIVIGAAAGSALGLGLAVAHGGVSDEFLEDLAKKMKPGDFAVLAEVYESWTAPIDTRMAALGATVVREQRSDVIDELIERRVNTHKAAVEQRKAEHASHKAQRREAKVEEDLWDARGRLQRIADKASHRLDATHREMQQKLEALDAQAKKATPEVRAQLEQRITEVRANYAERDRKLTQAIALAQEALQ